MTDITHPIIKEYAKKCDADFRIISKNKGIHPHYRILQLYDLFKEYDRILCIDSDTLILKSCPDIFKIVEPQYIASIYEDKGSRQEDRINRIKKIQNERGSVNWKSGYINSGIILFSRMHRDLFNITEDELYLDLGYDDVLLKYRAEKMGYKFYELSCEFNFMSMFIEPPFNKKKSDAYILHFAGRGFHPQINRTEQIKQDYLILKKYSLI
jgi:lipopolysaccharide biosynthesis glycosyltransferase